MGKIDIEILPGQETRIYGELLEDFEAGEILTPAQTSNYIFIELPSDHVPGYTNQLCYDLQMRGLTPIIAHPEQNLEFREQPNKLYSLVKNGTTTQVTSASITGDLGKKVQRFTFELIEAHLTHFIASNAHNSKRRGFRMAKAFEIVNKKYGQDYRDYFLNNSEFVVQGKDIYKEMPERIRKRKLLGFI